MIDRIIQTIDRTIAMPPYNEDTLAQQTTADFFEQELAWESLYAFRETLGSNGLLGRETRREVILTRYLRSALERINPGHPAKAYEDAISTLRDSPSSKDTFAINRDKHKLIRDGFQATYQDPNGKTQKPILRYIDFNQSKNNHFLCVRELWITDQWGRDRRADIIGFINGIPLLFCELKNLNKDLRVAYTDNYTDYLDTIKHLFYYNAIVLLGNGIQAKIGSLGSPYEYFHDWKRLEEREPGCVDMETLLRGVCDKTNFLDIIENFIIFDDSGPTTAKIIAQNHQYLGVNRAVESVKNRHDNNGKLGVFWHTQGSGKSYSMVFFTQKIQRKLGGNFSFIICTDRKDLDEQIYETFTGCGLANNDTDPCRTSSHEQLGQFLQDRKAFIFTLIQKFNKPLETPNPRDDIIVISDEAHRSQYGTFARNMRDALPNAGYIGFTGTPLISIAEEKELTREIFGDYVSTYDFQRAVDDHATVPLYYDARGEKLEVITNEVNDRIAEKLAEVESSGEDDNTIDRLKKALGKDYGILTSEDRLDAIAQDFVEHYSTSWGIGKAMFICLDKLTCVKMYNKITQHWQRKIAELKTHHKTLTDQQAAAESDRKIAWMEQTITAVMVSNEQNEVKKFQDWGLDINPHRALINNGFELDDGKRISLEKAFKKEDHPFRVAIICAMWLTGFDVPSLSILYLDKPLKAHTLMQAIARANRVNTGKHNGLIVDYCGILEHLRAALKTFAGEKDDGRGNEDGVENPVIDPTKPQLELLEELKKAIAALTQFFQTYNIELQQIIDSEGFQKNHLLHQATIPGNTLLPCAKKSSKSTKLVLPCQKLAPTPPPTAPSNFSTNG
ncbi:MAG: type I restriction endonuclease subunit R [Prochlorotrichaceae cyanobacterium]